MELHGELQIRVAKQTLWLQAQGHQLTLLIEHPSALAPLVPLGWRLFHALPTLAATDSRRYALMAPFTLTVKTADCSLTLSTSPSTWGLPISFHSRQPIYWLKKLLPLLWHNRPQRKK
ncbi:MAG: hypothetical protein R3Y10_05755 [Ferrimonas sp.]